MYHRLDESEFLNSWVSRFTISRATSTDAIIFLLKSSLFLISTEMIFIQIQHVYTYERSTRKAGAYQAGCLDMGKKANCTNINNLRAKLFIGSTIVFQQYISSLHTDMTQAVEIFLHASRELTYSKSQYHRCWGSSDARSQGNSIYGIYYVEPN